MRFKPKEDQKEAIRFALTRPAVALFLDCGKGKTGISLSVVNTLLKTLESKGVLVVAPLRVARLTWPLEMAKWSNFKWMKHTFLHGDYKLVHLNTEADIYLINYEGLVWLRERLDNISVKDWPFDTIIWDEITKIKSHSSVRYKKWKKLIKHFQKRIGLTGTPAPNSSLDLYSQVYVLDAGERFGGSFDKFRKKYFYQDDYQGYYWKPHESTHKKIGRLLKDVVLRMREKEITDRPGSVVKIVDVVMPAKNRKQYQKLEEDMFIELEGIEVEALNAAVLTGKLLQFTSGAVYATEDEVPQRHWEEVHDAKMKALKTLVKKIKTPVLIGYAYQHEVERIKKAFPKAVHFNSSMSVAAEKQLQQDWSDGKIPQMIGHPASIGHGLNLQFGGHTIIWFTPPWPLEGYVQFNKRLDRQGQKHLVEIYVLIMTDSIDEVVMVKQERKSKNQEEILSILEMYRDSKIF